MPFYLFRLPFYELLQSSLTALTLITLLAVLVSYAYFGSLRFSGSRQMKGWSAKAVPHVSILFLVLVASWGWGFIGSGIYVGLYLIAVLLVPTLFQRFMVQPNELACWELSAPWPEAGCSIPSDRRCKRIQPHQSLRGRDRLVGLSAYLLRFQTLELISM